VLPLGDAEGELVIGSADALALGFPGLSSPNSLPKPLQRSGLLTLISDSGAVALRIDAQLQPGMSGGPVVLSSTRVVVGLVHGGDEQRAEQGLSGVVIPLLQRAC